MSWATTVRTDAVSRIIAAGTSAGSRVYDSRRQEIPLVEPTRSTTELPAVCVHTTQMRREARGHSAGLVTETTTLVVQCFVGDDVTEAAIAAALDTLEDAVFGALWDDQTWVSQYAGVKMAIADTTLTRQTESNRNGYAVLGFDLSRNRTRTIQTGGEPLNTIKQAVSLVPSDEVKVNAALDELDGEPTP